jgi:hypothetical protein
MLCIKCKTEKPTTEFYYDKNSASGYDNRCKSCERERGRIYRELHRDKVRESNNRYSKTDKGKARALRFYNTDKHKEILKRHKATGKSVNHVIAKNMIGYSLSGNTTERYRIRNEFQ